MSRIRPAWILAILITVAVLSLGWALAAGPLRDPQAALRDFYEAQDRAEDQLMDPLILNGRRVVPLVLGEVQNPDMRLRRYAIGFLGNGRYSEALNTLERIVGNESEIYYLRADALLAIYQISPSRARELAPKYVSAENLLGKFASQIVAGENPVYWKRSFWEAFWHTHG